MTNASPAGYRSDIQRTNSWCTPDQRDLSMFQDYALWPHLMVRDNVALFTGLSGELPVQVRQQAADVAFRGRGYEHAIDIAGHGRLTNVFAATRARRGEVVGLRLDPAGCHLFPAGPAAAAAAPAGRPDTVAAVQHS